MRRTAHLLLWLVADGVSGLSMPRVPVGRGYEGRGRGGERKTFATRGRGGRGGGSSPYRSRAYEPFDEFDLPRDRRRRPAAARPGSEDDDFTPLPQRGRSLAPPPGEFTPKVWQAEAAGGTADFFSRKTFEELGAEPELVQALGACGADKPSHVQAIGFGSILRGDDVALADQTGSGKTLAYLGPLVQRLRQTEREQGRTPGGHVRALVLVPTSELAQQVLSVAKALAAGGAPFRSTIITGEHKWATQRKCADKGMELIVATPGRLKSHLEAEQGPSFALDSAITLVLDEADLLFEVRAAGGVTAVTEGESDAALEVRRFAARPPYGAREAAGQRPLTLSRVYMSLSPPCARSAG